MTSSDYEDPLKKHLNFSFKEGLISNSVNVKQVDGNAIINYLNFIHFSEGNVLLHLEDGKDLKNAILAKASLKVYQKNEITCCCLDEGLPDFLFEELKLKHLVIDDGQFTIVIPIEAKERNGKRFSFQLPRRGYLVGLRRAKRFACHDVSAQLTQNALLAEGKLLEFNPNAFRIAVKAQPPLSFSCFNPDSVANVLLRNNQQVLFSNRCRCIRQDGNLFEKEIVLAPVDEDVSRFEKKPIRNPRRQLIPSPSIIFCHPFFGRKIQLKVSDVSTTGFSVYEGRSDGTLMKGMIIPDSTLDFAGALKIRCTAQVVYRLQEEKGLRWGLAILDMDINGYTNLASIITNAIDPNAFNSNDIDLDSLIKFFYDAGFIYPDKHHAIISRSRNFKDTYRKVYAQNSEIAKHFAYQKNGQIYGHVSMVRAYEKTWVVHHHAAKAMDGKPVGFIVLNQLNHFLNDMHRLPSLKTNYIWCYFRPENKFPDRVFGGFARALKNPRGCSTDLFSYLIFRRESRGIPLRNKWTLRNLSPSDRWVLNRFYSHYSGGLLLAAMGLDKEMVEANLEDAYSRYGLLRRCRSYSLLHGEQLKAVIITDQSDPELNLSGLLNSIKVFVTSAEGLSWEILSNAITMVAGIYPVTKIPLLIFPSNYVEAEGLPCDKQYQGLIWDARYMNYLIEYIQKKFRVRYWE